MSDLVKKLRGHQHHPDRDPKLRCFDCEAADRIEELKAKLEAVVQICESRLGSIAYTDAISDIHTVALKGDKS